MTSRHGMAGLGKAGLGTARHGLHSQQNTIQEAGYEEKN